MVVTAAAPLNQQVAVRDLRLHCMHRQETAYLMHFRNAARVGTPRRQGYPPQPVHVAMTHVDTLISQVRQPT